jgi:hypothetical protein
MHRYTPHPNRRVVTTRAMVVPAYNRGSLEKAPTDPGSRK